MLFMEERQNRSYKVVENFAPLDSTLHLVDCWYFTSWQHPMSHQDGYRLVPVCTHHGAAPLGNQAASSMTRYPTKVTYPINARLRSDKCQFCMSLV